MVRLARFIALKQNILVHPTVTEVEIIIYIEKSGVYLIMINLWTIDGFDAFNNDTKETICFNTRGTMST